MEAAATQEGVGGGRGERSASNIGASERGAENSLTYSCAFICVRTFIALLYYFLVTATLTIPSRPLTLTLTPSLTPTQF